MPPRLLPAAPRLVLIRFSSLGDVVKCTALPRLIKARYPDSHLTFLTAEANAELLRDNPHVDRVLSLPKGAGLGALRTLARALRAEQPHLLIDVHNSLRSRLLRLQVGAPTVVYNKRTMQRWSLIAFGINTYRGVLGKEADFLLPLAPYGIKDDGQGTALHTGRIEAEPGFRQKFSADLARIAEWRAAGKPVLGVAPVAAWELKRWPMEHVEQLLRDYVAATGGGIVLFGGPGDSDVMAFAERFAPHAINLAGRTSFLESAALARQVDLMLANDTGMSHIAEAVGTDALVIFGPTSRELGYYPVRRGSRVLERDLPCRPCTRMGEGRCTHPWPKACLRGITPQEALSAVLDMLGRPGAVAAAI